MDDQQRVDLVTCSHCGARRPNNTGPCWLCGLYLAEPAGTPLRVEPVLRSTPRRPGLKNAVAILVGLVVALVAIDLFLQAPGLALAMLVIVAPAFVALGMTMDREGTGAPSFGGVFAMLAFSVVGVMLTVGLVITAAIAAVLAFCSMIFSIGPR